MRFKKLSLLAFLWVLALPVQAKSLSLQLSDDVARFFYNTSYSGENAGRLEIETGLLYNDNSDLMLSVGALVRGESVDMPVIVAVGGRLYHGDFDPLTFSALALGGDLMIRPASWKGFGIGFNFYHAPKVTSFNDAESITDASLTLNFQITSQANIYVGTQRIEADIVGAGDVVIEKGGFVGIDMFF